jgi:hypothetical protein
MDLHGKFVINDAHYSPLFAGVGTFLAFLAMVFIAIGELVA